MEFYTFTDYSVFTYIWIPVIVSLGAGIRGILRSKACVRIFYSALEYSADVDFRKKYLKTGLSTLAIIMLMLGLSGPKWDPRSIELQQTGRDIVILLDVSKSMMCRDMKPNRLEQAKIAIEDLANRLEGDRIGLVVFSGAPKLISPLTTDYSYLLTVLKEIDVNTVAHGGTLIGDAITYAAEHVYPEKGKAFRDIILITDGEDHGSFPVQQAERAYKEKHIHIHVFGLGDDTHGAKVPEYDQMGEFTGFKKYNGQFVYSKLDSENQLKLKKMAQITRGSFLYAGTGTVDLAGVYEKKILTASRREISSRQAVQYREGYQFFVLAGLVFILSAYSLKERRS